MPLVFNLVAVIDAQELPAIISSDWVVSKVKKICHVVGFSCEEFEKQMLALFTAIEVGTRIVWCATLTFPLR
jgi:hypothetical protein